MSHTHHAFEFLDASDLPPATVCVVFGDEPFLKQLVLKKLRQQILGEGAGVPFASFEGKSAEWRDVIDELSTVSLFGGNTRLAVIDPADDFVSTCRTQLEDYVAKPKGKSTLILVVETWQSSTRLYKAVDKCGLQIECCAPQTKRGKSKFLDEKRLCRWLSSWAKSRHAATLPAESAEALLELVGPHLGLLDQELAKLALFTEAKGKVTPELVNDVVGGWRTKTIWELVDAATDGNAAVALTELNRLLQAGEHPLALFGSISWSLRRFAGATRIYEQAEREGRRMKLSEALEQAGVRRWPRDALANAERRLMQLGRERAGKFYRWLLEADLAMKGSHSTPHRARLVLERLILRMAKQLATSGKRSSTAAAK